MGGWVMGGLRGFWMRIGEGWRTSLIILAMIVGIFVLWIVVTTIGVVVAVLLDPVLAGVDDLKDTSAIVQAFVAAFAILAAGIFAAYKLQIFRNLQPHLTISHEITHRVVSDSYVHISVTAVLRNSSRVKVEIEEGSFHLLRIAPVTDEEVERLYEQVFRDASKKNLQWEILDEINRDWNSGELIVEPGESHPETYEFIVSREFRSVLVYTYFYNPAYSEGAGVAQGWHATTVYDINNL